MANQLADYEVIGAVADDGVLPCSSARRPARLGDGGTVTVWVLGPLARAPLTSVRRRLEHVAAVRSPHLPDWLEAGAGEWAGRPVVFTSATTVVTGTLAGAQGMTMAAKLRALAAAARGAHALHEAGVLHGGICPQAICLTGPSDGQAVLAPPPLADGHQPLLQVGYPPLGFVDPHLLRGEAGRWSDIWALGATLQAATSGSPPFPDKDDVPVVQALAQLLAVPQPVPPEAPPLVAELARQCLATDPSSRPRTASEVADRLDQAAELG